MLSQGLGHKTCKREAGGRRNGEGGCGVGVKYDQSSVKGRGGKEKDGAASFTGRGWGVSAFIKIVFAACL